MPHHHTITVTCHKCGHEWLENLARAAAERVIYRNETESRIETYIFTCPRCGARLVVEVEREA